MHLNRARHSHGALQVCTVEEIIMKAMFANGLSGPRVLRTHNNAIMPVENRSTDYRPV